ncbi:MAG TPA: prevent-host-death protein [Thermoanaerobaculia bacterium]|nr:prevent-host-death protein [Thermoanaerobaculia bacterium]
MIRVDLQEARTRLDDLVDEATQGEEVVITRKDGASWKIVPMPAEPPAPRFGSAQGMVRMADDFDAPLHDFEDYAP